MIKLKTIRKLLVLKSPFANFEVQTSQIYCHLTWCLLSAGSPCLHLQVDHKKTNSTFTHDAFNAVAQSCRANRWLNVNTSQTEGLTATPQVFLTFNWLRFTLCVSLTFCFVICEMSLFFGGEEAWWLFADRQPAPARSPRIPSRCQRSNISDYCFNLFVRGHFSVQSKLKISKWRKGIQWLWPSRQSFSLLSD